MARQELLLQAGRQPMRLSLCRGNRTRWRIQLMSRVADVLIAHRWMASLRTCMCQYGKGIEPLGSPRQWAEHVNKVLTDEGLLR
jgi:hypothetical protein